MPALILGLPDRFWSKTRIEDCGYETYCLTWTAYCLPNGYARYCHDKQAAYAHRVVYEAIIGPIPTGLFIDHLCRNRACVNPWHLEPVTNRVNILRGQTVMAANATKTHCAHGHEFTTENTIRSGPDGRLRHCRSCRENTYAERNRQRRLLRVTNPAPPRTHCKRGHLLDVENTHVRVSDSARICRTCMRDSALRREAQRTADA